MRIIFGAEVPGKLDDIWALFKETGSFSAQSYISLGYTSYDVYVVGGGGGGALGGLGDTSVKLSGGGGGGGGGGGFNKALNRLLASLSGTVAVTVGLGGSTLAGKTPTGGLSQFTDIPAYGGGAGGVGSNSSGTYPPGFGGGGGGGGGTTGSGSQGSPGTSGGALGGLGSSGGGKGGKGFGAVDGGFNVLRVNTPATAGIVNQNGFGGGGGGGGGRGTTGPSEGPEIARANLSAAGYNSLGGIPRLSSKDPVSTWRGEGAGGGGGVDLTELTGQPGLLGDGNSVLPGGGGRGGSGHVSFSLSPRDAGASGCVLLRLYA